MKFVDIETVFQEGIDRSVEALTSVYASRGQLQDRVHKIVSRRLNPSALRGMRVLIKPNWVLQDRRMGDEICLRTHDSFLLACLSTVAECGPASILVGDAPIQGCSWEAVVTEPLRAAIAEVGGRHGVHIAIKDFRRTTFNPAENNPVRERNPISEYVIADLGRSSYLEEISTEKSSFRVMDYDCMRLAESHRPGTHKYCMVKDLFECDVIISMPKVKTHQKAGITAALKNLVGVNGDKDYLPHHRVGGAGIGGDCYPGANVLRRAAEWALDAANKRQGRSAYRYWQSVAEVFWRLSLPGNDHHLDAAWHGNDTVWRMVLDLNRIALFGRADGSIAKDQQRVLYSLCDGVIAGAGDGPLRPTPHPLGIISFTNDSAMNDICMAILMGYDPTKIPLLNAARNLAKDQDEINLTLSGKNILQHQLSSISIQTPPPPGWRSVLSE